MSKMKQLAVDLEEFRDEIDLIMSQVWLPSQGYRWEVLSNDGFSTEEKDFVLKSYTSDPELRALIIAGIKLKGITKNEE